MRDWCAVNITLQRGLTGAKPARLIHWVCDLLGVQLGDTVDDLFPGTGAVTHAVDGYLGRVSPAPGSLFEQAS